MRGKQFLSQIDWVLVFLYLVLVIAGWINIYAADFDYDAIHSIFDLNRSSGRQLLWIASSLALISLILLMDFRFFESFAFLIYGGFLVLLVAVLIFGKEVAGSTSWFEIGSFKLQPSEFTKIGVALALAKFLNLPNRKIGNSQDLLVSGLIFLVPLVLVILQGDAGTAIVYASFFIVLFREGMAPTILILAMGVALVFILTLVLNQALLIIGIIVIGLIIMGLYGKTVKNYIQVGIFIAFSIGIVISVDFVLNNVLKPHQQKRVMSLVNPNADPLGVGWNVLQSKIAIGSGGFTGKGFLQGTQTKFDFVPEQTTDFIFCTIGEEHGWIGSSLTLIVFGLLLLRVSAIAERQKSNFVRVYGYGVLSVILFHFSINVAMTIGLFPVIGIPLPFFSYGGSSLWAFSVLLFILIKLDGHRTELLHRW